MKERKKERKKEKQNDLFCFFRTVLFETFVYFYIYERLYKNKNNDFFFLGIIMSFKSFI